MAVQLAEAQAEVKTARNAQEANDLTVVALLARNKELDDARNAAERRCQEQVERSEADVAEVRQIKRFEVLIQYSSEVDEMRVYLFQTHAFLGGELVLRRGGACFCFFVCLMRLF